MNRAIVTGATGAIGTALVRELTEAGTEVLVFVREDSARNRNIPDHPLVRRISCAQENLAEIQNTTGTDWDVFYHLAWAGTSGPERNDMYLQNRNVKYALDAVTAAGRFGCRRFIGIGSQAEYGRSEEKLKPDTPVRPETGYGYAKLCAGQMTRDYARRLGMEHVWVRVLSVYGPHDGAQSMVMSTIRKLCDGLVPEFTKAEQQWDYLYSGDAARALRLLGKAGTASGTYVLGSGQARPLAEYIETIRDIAAPGQPLEIGKLPYAPNQVMYLCADTSALERDTGWRPETSFEDGIRAILASLKESEET